MSAIDKHLISQRDKDLIRARIKKLRKEVLTETDEKEKLRLNQLIYELQTWIGVR